MGKNMSGKNMKLEERGDSLGGGIQGSRQWENGKGVERVQVSFD